MKRVFSFLHILFIGISCNQQDGQNNETYNSDKKNKRISYTKHALCRMDCRMIDSLEVMEVIDAGIINTKKSNPTDVPCPSVSFEGITHDNQNVRIVVGDCQDEYKIITVIDLEKEYQCNCY